MALANMEELLRVSGGSVEIDPLPVVIGRRTHFVQLFQNLIGNSLKYRGDRTPNVRVCVPADPWRVHHSCRG